MLECFLELRQKSVFILCSSFSFFSSFYRELRILNISHDLDQHLGHDLGRDLEHNPSLDLRHVGRDLGRDLGNALDLMRVVPGHGDDPCLLGRVH